MNFSLLINLILLFFLEQGGEAKIEAGREERSKKGREGCVSRACS